MCLVVDKSKPGQADEKYPSRKGGAYCVTHAQPTDGWCIYSQISSRTGFGQAPDRRGASQTGTTIHRVISTRTAGNCSHTSGNKFLATQLLHWRIVAVRVLGQLPVSPLGLLFLPRQWTLPPGWLTSRE